MVIIKVFVVQKHLVVIGSNKIISQAVYLSKMILWGSRKHYFHPVKLIIRKLSNLLIAEKMRI